MAPATGPRCSLGSMGGNLTRPPRHHSWAATSLAARQVNTFAIDTSRIVAPSPPDRIRIPSIRVDAPLTGLGLTRTGSLDVPPAAELGWPIG